MPAVEYQITDSTWRPRTLAKFAEAYLAEAPIENLSEPAVTRVGARVEGRLFTEGSVRGVDFVYAGRKLRTAVIRVRLGTLASRTDWGLAFGLLRALVEQGRGTLVDPEGDPVRIEQLTEGEAAGFAMPHLTQGAAELKANVLDRGRPFAALPAPDYDLLVTADDFDASLADDALRLGIALEEQLAPRALRYERAMTLPVMAAPDGSAFAFWPWCDALIDAVPFVAVARNEEDEPRVIPGRQLFQALGDGFESVSADERRVFLYGDPSTGDFQTAFENAIPFPAWIASKQPVAFG